MPEAVISKGQFAFPSHYLPLLPVKTIQQLFAFISTVTSLIRWDDWPTGIQVWDGIRHSQDQKSWLAQKVSTMELEGSFYFRWKVVAGALNLSTGFIMFYVSNELKTVCNETWNLQEKLLFSFHSDACKVHKSSVAVEWETFCVFLVSKQFSMQFVLNQAVHLP